MRGRHPQRPLAVTIDPDLPMVHADPMLLRRVLDNLLENAHKYTPDTTQTIELTATRDGDHVSYEVGDKGVGITPEDLPRVFTAFFRGERSRSRETGGVGLGLTLAKRITEAHGGTIGATSQAGVGTQMRVTIPSA
jgi:signal transduction histidine kinase